MKQGINHNKKDSKRNSSLDTQCITDVLEHYRHDGRHTLPWRGKSSPYGVLVSEIMLQQTQVVRVLPKYRAWMKKFPTLASLGKSSLEEILLFWQGLGYQRRAKALFLIAKRCKCIPTLYEELLLLPGVGVYTAGAIHAFAYNKFSHPFLETNIRTVLIEYFHKDEMKIDDRVLYGDLDRLVETKKVRGIGAKEWYYALMDYGAYLKSQNISHNKKSKHHVVQFAYKGSVRELRAKVLFAITRHENLPEDVRTANILQDLMAEGFILRKGKKYIVM